MECLSARGNVCRQCSNSDAASTGHTFDGHDVEAPQHRAAGALHLDAVGIYGKRLSRILHNLHQLCVCGWVPRFLADAWGNQVCRAGRGAGVKDAKQSRDQGRQSGNKRTQLALPQLPAALTLSSRAQRSRGIQTVPGGVLDLQTAGVWGACW